MAASSGMPILRGCGKPRLSPAAVSGSRCDAAAAGPPRRKLDSGDVAVVRRAGRRGDGLAWLPVVNGEGIRGAWTKVKTGGCC
ncbi:hypothetical protein DsansV1_C09g0094521 [Dioscorea sansibarensis]